jgi:hypothetical protein
MEGRQHFPELFLPDCCSDPHTYVCTNNHVDKPTRLDYVMFNSGCFCKLHSVSYDKSFGFEDSGNDHVAMAAAFSFVCAKKIACIKIKILSQNDPSSRDAFISMSNDLLR